MADSSRSIPPRSIRPRSISHRLGRRGTIAAVAAGMLVLGGGAGALAVEATRPSVTMAPATPVAIRSLSDDGIVTIRGRVVEVFGNKFVMADSTGRALVDTGRQGEDGGLIRPSEAVTVQGRFDRGFLHAAFLVGPDGKVTALEPLGGPHGRHGPHGDGPDHGPGPDDRAAPPPPALAAVAAPSVTPVATAVPATR